MTLEPLSTWVAAQGGVVHTTRALEAGYSRYAMAQSIDRAELGRIRRSWLALPDCDERLRVAAAAGGRVSCVDGAGRQGAWVPAADGTTHLALHPSASRVTGDRLTRHWGDGPSPVPPHTIEDDIINVLFHVARCQPARLALAVWESAVTSEEG